MLMILNISISISYILSAASLLHQQEQSERHNNDFDFIKFRVYPYELKLIRVLPHSKFSVTIKEYSNFQECINVISDILSFNVEAISPVTIEIPSLINSLKLYMEVMYKFNDLPEKCINSIKSEVPSMDIVKVASDLMFNKEILYQLINANRSFENCLHKFSFIVFGGNHYVFFDKQIYEFIQMYVEILYKEMFGSFLFLNTMKNYIEFKNNHKSEIRNIIELFISSFSVVLFKHALNIFALIFEQYETPSGKELVVRESIRSLGMYREYGTKHTLLSNSISHISEGFESSRNAKFTAEAIFKENWRIRYILDTNKIIGSLLNTLFDNLSKF